MVCSANKRLKKHHAPQPFHNFKKIPIFAPLKSLRHASRYSLFTVNYSLPRGAAPPFRLCRNLRPLHLAERGSDGGQVPIFEPIRVLWEQSGKLVDKDGRKVKPYDRQSKQYITMYFKQLFGTAKMFRYKDGF